MNYVSLLKLVSMAFTKLLRTKLSCLVGSLVLICITCLYCVFIFIARTQFPIVLFVGLELLGLGIVCYLVKETVKLFSKPNR